MIPLSIRRRPAVPPGSERLWQCDSDDDHRPLASFLEALHDEIATEMFADLGALLAGGKDHVEIRDDAQRATIEPDRVRFHHMSSAGATFLLEISFDDLIDAVLRWFDAVEPNLASDLRKLQATWPVRPVANTR
jgi:hypothetical protein